MSTSITLHRYADASPEWRWGAWETGNLDVQGSGPTRTAAVKDLRERQREFRLRNPPE